MTDDNKAFGLSKDLIVTVDGYYDKFTWNAAIEAAAKIAESSDGVTWENIAINVIPENIRKLKR